MYSVPNNQLLQQLTQLTCGVVATVTNTRVRTSTPRKLKLNKTSHHQQQHGRAFLPMASSASTSTSSSTFLKSPPPQSSNGPICESVSVAATACDTTEFPKTMLGPLLSAQFSKLGIEGFKSDPEFNQAVSSIAETIMSRSASGGVGVNDLTEPSFIGRIWNDIVQTVNTSVNSSSSTGWAEKFLKNQQSLIMKQFQHNEAQGPSHSTSTASTPTYLRFQSALFDSDRRFLKPFGGIGLYDVPFRTFKTRRDIDAASGRNPSILARVKDKFQGSKESTPGGAPITGDKLKAMVADLPQTDADKLKVAFAEGYLSGSGGGGGTGEKSRAYRWLRTLQQVLAIAVFTAILASLMGSFGGGMFRVSVGNGNEVQPEDINVTFDDVKGVDEAKQELQEIVDFLKNPAKFVALGGKLPKGVLLVGPPGTGKTLLARAVAGEAGVPFFHAAGPEFDEILVGQGARRVRDLFKAAKLKAPCVVFIDEIDSVGAKRTNSVLHPYANQTINQLLSEMDGFRQNEGVIVLGATNRREDLDKALLRPGRFDVEVPVPAPEYTGRKEILDYYLSKVKMGNDIDVDLLARGTTGFTGADLENMINQAALKAAIDGADSVGKKHLDFARDKVIMGPQRKNRIPDEDANKITAYHEAGHAIASYFTKEANPIHKVTIIPRGPSLGHTAYIPDKEQYHITKSQLMAMMDTMMGGRAAEELIFGIEKITSGASSDLKQATAIATHMVKEWGMSEKVGLRTVDDQSKAFVTVNDLGPQTTELMDSEIKRILQESYDRAKTILKVHAKEHKALAEALMMYETLDADDVKAILSGQPPITPLVKKEKDTTKPIYPLGGKPSGGIGGVCPSPAPPGQKRLPL